MEQIQINPFP